MPLPLEPSDPDYPIPDVFAEVSDVEAMFRVLNEAETIRATRWIAYVSRLIRQAVPTVDHRIARGLLDPELVKDVTVAVVVRALRNPEGAKAETIGPKSVTYDDRVAGGFVFLTEDEIGCLLPSTRPGLGIGTINVRSAL